VRVVYSDESGTGDIGKEPITVVCAVMLNLDNQWEPVERALQEVPRFKRRELKGTRLLRDIRIGRKPKADATLRQVLNIIRANHLSIFYGAVNREGFKRANSITETGYANDLHVAFSQCLERVANYIYTSHPKEKVLWIADSGREREIRREQSLARFADVVTINGHTEESAQPTCIVDTVYFGSSEHSLAIQLADICCYVITQKLMNNADILPYYRLIKMQIINDGTLPDFT